MWRVKYERCHCRIHFLRGAGTEWLEACLLVRRWKYICIYMLMEERC